MMACISIDFGATSYGASTASPFVYEAMGIKPTFRNYVPTTTVVLDGQNVLQIIGPVKRRILSAQENECLEHAFWRSVQVVAD